MGQFYGQPNGTTGESLASEMDPKMSFWLSFGTIAAAIVVMGLANAFSALMSWGDLKLRQKDIRTRQDWSTREETHIRRCEAFKRDTAAAQSATDEKLVKISEGMLVEKTVADAERKNARGREGEMKEQLKEMELRLRKAETILAIKEGEVED
ncbi:hypothetical protein GGR53DRAFT_487588 [Hypoxylon sp. FL1150]|nr:hypothetical protein GGR53DRAFT_487588 [Hypoxylon sp. FL1150]